jgi:hypothetical protein
MRYGMRAHTISMAIGLTSLVMAVLLPAAFAGLIYFLMGPLHGWNGYKAGKAKAALAEPPAVPLPTNDD